MVAPSVALVGPVVAGPLIAEWGRLLALAFATVGLLLASCWCINLRNQFIDQYVEVATVQGRLLTLVCVLPASPGGLEGEVDRVQREVGQHHAWHSRIRRR